MAVDRRGIVTYSTYVRLKLTYTLQTICNCMQQASSVFVGIQSLRAFGLGWVRLRRGWKEMCFIYCYLYARRANIHLTDDLQMYATSLVCFCRYPKPEGIWTWLGAIETRLERNVLHLLLPIRATS
jgi:hypothetical protein